VRAHLKNLSIGQHCGSGLFSVPQAGKGNAGAGSLTPCRMITQAADKHSGVRGDLSVDRLTCRMPPMGVFRRCKRACALQVAGKALSSQGPDFTRSHNQIWSTTPLRLKKNFDADNSRCC
jgi:hypothetical protein